MGAPSWSPPADPLCDRHRRSSRRHSAEENEPPLETVRLWQMVNGKGHPLRVAMGIARAEGLRTLWRGNAANVMKAAPQKAKAA